MAEVATGYFRKFLENINGFWEERENIYIYGAGKYAKNMYQFLNRHDKMIKGFLVTGRAEGNYEGKPVIPIQSIAGELDSSVGIILAMKAAFQNEVRDEYGELFGTRAVGLLFVDELILQSICMGPEEGRMEEWRRQFGFGQNIDKDTWKNILVIHLEQVIGDYIWGTAFLRELRANLPESHITYVVSERAYGIFQNCPYVDNLLLYGTQTTEMYSEDMEEGVKAFVEAYLGSRQYDVVFMAKAVPHNEYEVVENVLMALYSRAKVCIAHGHYIFLKEIIYTDFWKSLFPIMVLHDKAEHDVSKDLSLLRICGFNIRNEKMELWTSPEEKRWARNLLEDFLQPGGKIVIALGVAAREPRRSWPAEAYVELIRRMGTRNQQLCYVIFGGDNAVEAAEIITKSSANILNIAGKTTLSESIAVMEECHIYVGSDTSLLHMAAAFGHPVVELTANLKDGCETDMGHPVRTGPWKVPGKVIYPQKQLDGCTHVCEKEYAHCITQIVVGEVEEAVLDVLSVYR